MGTIAAAIRSYHDPLPDLTKDERQHLEQLARLVKAGALARTTLELHRRDGVLLLTAEAPAETLKCK